MANARVRDAIAARFRPSRAVRPRALICKAGPVEVIDACMLELSRETEVEHIPSLAEGMERCLKGGIDILFVNLFSFTARELTALAAFRSLRPSQPVVAVAGPEMEDAFIGSDIADAIHIVGTPTTSLIPSRA